MILKQFTHEQVGYSFVFLKDVISQPGNVMVPIYRVRQVINCNNGTQVYVINMKSFQGDVFTETDQLVQNSEVRFMDLPR